MSEPRPFKIDIAQSVIDGIVEKVRTYQWHEMPEIPEGGDRWAYGTDMEYMKELCAYWTSEFDWRKAEARLNTYPQFTVEIDGLDIHFLHVKGSGKNPRPVIMTHGWPGSVFEFFDVIERLAHPEKFGGDAEDGLTLVMPSLPGYGFSRGLRKPNGPRGTAALWHKLMVDVLGHKKYIAQGGDWGSAVSGWIAADHSVEKGGECCALHYNMYGVYAPVKPETEEEKTWARNADAIRKKEFAYFHLQTTKPQTLSYAMMDSPVGVAAWITEKFYTWSDLRGPDGSKRLENVYTKDQLLTNIMIYLVTRSFNTATWFYRGMREERCTFLDPGTKIGVPTGIAVFPKELVPFPPRSTVEKGYNVVRWTEFDRGGHFAAMETKDVFASDVLAFARQVK